MTLPTPHFVTLSHGQIRVWISGEGPSLLLLPGLLHGPLARAKEAAAAFPGRTLVTIEVPGLGGSDTGGAFSISAAVAMLAEWTDALADPIDLLAFDFGMAMAKELKNASNRIGKVAWVDSGEVLAWPMAEDRLDRLDFDDHGTYLLKLWGHLRRRDMVRPDDPRRARQGRPYLSAEELDEALICFGAHPLRYAEHWIHASRICRELRLEQEADVGCGSLEKAAAYLVNGKASGQSLFPEQKHSAGHRVVRQYVPVSRGRAHLRRAGSGERLLLAFLAGSGSSSNLTPLLNGLSHARVVVAPDYIGQGDSCRNTTETTVAQLARDADEIASALGFEEYDVYGSHTGGGVAIEAAIAFPDRVRRVIIDGISMQDPAERSEHRAKYFPTIEPDLWGGHVHRAWHVRRDGSYFWPWYKPGPEFSRTGRALTLPLLHDRVISTLRSRTTPAYQAIALYWAQQRLSQVRQPTLFVAGPNDTFIKHMDAARAVAGANVMFVHTPATVWSSGQDADAVAETFRLFEDFLDASAVTI